MKQIPKNKNSNEQFGQLICKSILYSYPNVDIGRTLFYIKDNELKKLINNYLKNAV